MEELPQVIVDVPKDMASTPLLKNDTSILSKKRKYYAITTVIFLIFSFDIIYSLNSLINNRKIYDITCNFTMNISLVIYDVFLLIFIIEFIYSQYLKRQSNVIYKIILLVGSPILCYYMAIDNIPDMNSICQNDCILKYIYLINGIFTTGVSIVVMIGIIIICLKYYT
ncbi:MAG: hypothetical protein Edafosvirus2_62 [Edafosvirus sp.]|uniref:Uncharacterized protein n=1 Tax=Edafosvirus sp. TaxID=2487765 RepID=A0A3G4ZW95_9VIRU|nr:MAG: hypothetical protein Edafosvirus2_62 [Edafosvirus sp.]